MDTLSSPSLWDKLRATILTARAKSTDPADSGDPASYVRNVALGSLPTGGDVTDMLKLMVAMSGPQGRAQAGMAVGEAAKNVKPRDVANFALNTATQTALGGAGAVGTYKGAGALLRMMLKEHEVQYIKGMLGVPFTSKHISKDISADLARYIDNVQGDIIPPKASAEYLLPFTGAKKSQIMPPVEELIARDPKIKEAYLSGALKVHGNPYMPSAAPRHTVDNTLAKTLGKFYSYRDAEGVQHVVDWYHFYPWGPFNQESPNYIHQQREIIPAMLRSLIRHKSLSPEPIADLLEALAIRRGAGQHVIDWKLPDIQPTKVP